ncbi:MAG: ribbon-helix-helix protein, CopG family [Armatimonadetes bacterium]|jgi:hypothetical protein|nr:ribbon-helix-helix protein, CopG family [Armatimonadota bacterium]
MANKRFTISLPEDLFERMESEVARRRIPRSQLYAEVAEEYLARRKQRDMLARINAAYTDGPDPDDTAFLERVGFLLSASELPVL